MSEYVPPPRHFGRVIPPDSCGMPDHPSLPHAPCTPGYGKRTRLNQIVEEELAPADPGTLAAGMRIAHRVFRHATQRAAAVFFPFAPPSDQYQWACESVQPDPDEEKRFYCAEGNDHHAHGYGCIIDRRKFERRAGHEYRNAGNDSFIVDRGLPRGNASACPHLYAFNRRSGLDRRKARP